jgi:hypothetical protein
MDKFYFTITAIAASILGGLVWKLFQQRKPYLNKEEAEKAKEKKQDEIKNTPAADLVASDPNAGNLRADIAGIAGRAKQRLRDRTRDLVSGHNSSGNSNGGGN